MIDATLYVAGFDGDELVATVDTIDGFDVARPMLGALHEPAFSSTANVHRQALPFGSRQGALQLILTGPDAGARAAAIDAALRVNALYVFDCPHFAPLHRMRWALATEYAMAYTPAATGRAWTLTVTIKEVLG